MIGLKSSLTPIVLVASVTLTPGLAAADPVTLTGYGWASSVAMHLDIEDGRGFSMYVGWSANAGGIVPTSHAVEFQPGATVSLHAANGDDRLGGIVELEGLLYSVGDSVGDVQLHTERTAYASFDGVFIAPALAPAAIVFAPFVFRGGFDLDIYDTDPRHEHHVSGGGMATVHLRQSLDSQRWNIQEIRYDFAAADPVPEPATMVLVGVGMVGIARKYRSRALDARR